MVWRYWIRLNVICGWPILWLYDALLAAAGHDYRAQREQSNRALRNIWNGRDPYTGADKERVIVKCASENCPDDSGEYVFCEHHRKVIAAGGRITADPLRLLAHLRAVAEEQPPAAEPGDERSE